MKNIFPEQKYVSTNLGITGEHCDKQQREWMIEIKDKMKYDSEKIKETISNCFDKIKLTLDTSIEAETKDIINQIIDKSYTGYETTKDLYNVYCA